MMSHQSRLGVCHLTQNHFGGLWEDILVMGGLEKALGIGKDMIDTTSILSFAAHMTNRWKLLRCLMPLILVIASRNALRQTVSILRTVRCLNICVNLAIKQTESSCQTLSLICLRVCFSRFLMDICRQTARISQKTTLIHLERSAKN